MKISWSQLKHLPVQTEAGRKVGVVEGVEVDVNSHAVAHYEVKPGGSILGLFSKIFLMVLSHAHRIQPARQPHPLSSENRP